MSIGFFTDRMHKPTESELTEVLSRAQPLWSKLLCFITEHYNVVGILKFYGRNYGWALGFSKSGKSLVALYPGEGEFSVQIILNPSQVAEAIEHELGSDIKRIIEQTPQIHEGKWIYVKITEDRQIGDIEKLLLVRVKPKKKLVRTVEEG